MPIGAYDGESVNVIMSIEISLFYAVKQIQTILTMPVLMIVCTTFNAHSVWMG